MEEDGTWAPSRKAINEANGECREQDVPSHNPCELDTGEELGVKARRPRSPRHAPWATSQNRANASARLRACHRPKNQTAKMGSVHFGLGVANIASMTGGSDGTRPGNGFALSMRRSGMEV